jgi:nitrogen fixation protein FixH
LIRSRQENGTWVFEFRAGEKPEQSTCYKEIQRYMISGRQVLTRIV